MQQLPLPLLEEVLGFLGTLESFFRLFCQTSTAMAAFAEEHSSVWRCVESATVIRSGHDYGIPEACMPLLRKCAPILRKWVVRQADVLDPPHYQRTTPLYDLLRETPALRELVYKPFPRNTRSALRHVLPALPTGDGVLPTLERLEIGDYVDEELEGEATK